MVLPNEVLIIHGSGGHGHLAAHMAQKSGWLVRFTDDARGTRPVPPAPCHIGIGNNKIRAKYHAWNTQSLIHETAFIHTTAEIEDGAFIGPNSVINMNAVLGRNVIINTGAIVEHDCKIGDNVHIAPGAVLTGDVTVCEGAFIGANAVVKPGIRIGAWSIVGCGAVVIKDIPAGETWAGNPTHLVYDKNGDAIRWRC